LLWIISISSTPVSFDTATTSSLYKSIFFMLSNIYS
jgi:hypothetical protein